VKPQNVVRAEGGDLKVLDFGLARESEGSGEGVTSLDAVLGTVGFMAPEQAQGRWDLVDEATDVWAVGATLLKLATGLDAHEGATPQERLAFAATRPVPRVASRAPDLDPALADVIDRAMAYSRKERFASAEVMRRALDGVAHVESPASSAVAGSSSASASSPVAGSSSASAPAPREPAVAGRRLGVLPIVAVVLALALAAGYAATRPPPPLPSAPLAASTPPLLTSSPPAALTSAPTARAPVALSTGAPSAAALSPGLRAAPSLGRSAEAPVSAAPPSAAAPASVAPSTDPLDRRR
ncbi:MAG: protein kinase, partial [Myxococcales bacterium]|nr:protein kinase [Myxococcales bacterium]